MSLPELSFGKVWTNSKDFPQYEPDEAQVRKDFQYHPDAIKDFINKTFAPAIDAGYAKIVASQYVGDGTSGSDNPSTISLDFTPKLVVIAEPGSDVGPMVFTAGASPLKVSAYDMQVYYSMSDNTLTRYADSPNAQLNVADTTYYYVAIG